MSLTRHPDGTVEIPVSIPQTQIQSAYSQVVDQAVATAEIPGFRKGKAPRDVVGKTLNKTKIYDQVLHQLLPQILSQAIKTHNLKPIASPRLKPVSVKENSDWQFTLEVVEFPEFSLGNYQAHVRGALAATKIWVPGDEKNLPSDQASQAPGTPSLAPRNGAGRHQAPKNQSLSDKRLSQVFDALLDNIEVPLAQTLVEDEVNRALSHLLDQIQKLGLTLDSYLASLGKTAKSLREEYTTTAKYNLKLEFILLKIAADLKIDISDSEVDSLIAQAGDEKVRQKLNTPTERAYLKSVLRKRKTIDSLLKLA